MSKRILLALALSTAFAVPASAIDGTRVNGRAVSVHWFKGSQSWSTARCGAGEGWRGTLNVFTITGGAVTHQDTIYDATQGFAYYPAFNLDGTKIVFYRTSKGLATGSTCPSANGGKNTLAIIDVNGSNLRNLCDLPCGPPSEGGLDWPVGDWVYYVYPQCVAFPTDGSPNNNEIWKVNTITGENVKVCKYQGQGVDMPNCTYFRRFSLNLAANAMGVQVLQKYQCTDPSWFSNTVVSFPGGCNIGSGGGNCNMAISASGGYTAYYYGTGHDFIEFGTRTGSSKAPPSRVYLTEWGTAGAGTIGTGAELIRWAVNSDKWVLQQVGWYGHAGNMSFGTNQVACNWSDMVAITIARNPKVNKEPCGVAGQPDCCGGCGALYHGNCTGDMWIDGGTAGIGKYEDGNGVWQPAPGYVRATSEYAPAARDVAGPRILRSDANGTVRVATSEPATVSVYDTRGRVLLREHMTSGGSASIGSLPRGSYVVKVHSAFGASSEKFAVQ